MSGLWPLALAVVGAPIVIGVPWLLAGWLLKRELSAGPHPSARLGHAHVRLAERAAAAAAEHQAAEHAAAIARLRAQARREVQK